MPRAGPVGSGCKTCPVTISPYLSALLDSLVAHGRPLIRSEFTARSCIASTRIGLDVLAYFGVRAQEVPVLIGVFNAEAARMLDEGMALPDLLATMQTIPAEQPGGPWSIAIGASPQDGSGDPNGWSGHLVIGLTGLQVIVDLSADQASRPHKNMELACAWYEVPDDGWWAGEQKSAFLGSQNGALLMVHRNPPDPTGYLESANWRRSSRTTPQQTREAFKGVTGRIIRAVRADLKAGGFSA